MDRAVVTAKGRILFPAKPRRKFGIKKGTRVSLLDNLRRVKPSASCPDRAARSEIQATRFPGQCFLIRNRKRLAVGLRLVV